MLPEATKVDDCLFAKARSLFLLEHSILSTQTTLSAVDDVLLIIIYPKAMREHPASSANEPAHLSASSFIPALEVFAVGTSDYRTF